MRSVSALKGVHMGGLAVVKIDAARRCVAMGQQAETFAAWPLHDKVSTDHSVAVGKIAVAIKRRPTPGWRQKRAVIVRPKMIGGDEDEGIGAKTKINVHGRVSIPSQADASLKARPRGQRRPTTIAFVCAIAPAHPRRRPFITGRPDPAVTRILQPTAIMKSVLAPGIIRLPEPAGPRVFPMAGIKIRTPTQLLILNIGPPAKTVSRDIDPLTERRKLTFKIADGHDRGRRGSCGYCRRDRCRSR